MKLYTLLFLAAALLQIDSAQAQSNDLCARLEKMTAAAGNAPLAENIIGEFVDEDLEFDTYESKLEFDTTSITNVYTLPDTNYIIGYDQWITDYTIESEAQKVYNDYFAALKQCYGATIKDQTNPAPKSGEAVRMTGVRISPLLVIKLFLMVEHDELSVHSMAGEDHYVFMSMGMEEE